MSGSNSLQHPLRGIVPPMVTPLSESNTLDAAGLERLIEHILGGGVHGIFLLGTTGEGPSISYELRRELIVRSCRQVDGRVPVLVGITDTSFHESVRVARWAAEAGAAALVLSTPYYFPSGQAELLEYLRHLVPALPLPVFLYNMPAMTKTIIEPETLRCVLALPGVLGLKDSSGDMAYFKAARAVADARPDWSVLVGPELLLAESMALGGDGGVCGGANVCPRLFVDWFNACEAGDTRLSAELAARAVELSQLYRIGSHGSAIIKGIKCALSVLDICDDVMAEPFARFAAPERARVRALIEQIAITKPIF